MKLTHGLKETVYMVIFKFKDAHLLKQLETRLDLDFNVGWKNA